LLACPSMSSTNPEAIPEDHAMWSVLTSELVSEAVRELSLLSRSPGLQRLYEIIVQHPSKPTTLNSADQRVHNESASIPNLSDRTCVRHGRDVGLTRRKRKNSEGDVAENGREAKKSKGKDWKMDGLPPGPTQEADMMVSMMGSAISAESLPNLIKLVQALIARKTSLKSVDVDDYGIEATLKLCDINCTNRALKDFYHMIGYIRLALHLDR
jgi:hypothetical protein